jgi:hypothetical protein
MGSAAEYCVILNASGMEVLYTGQMRILRTGIDGINQQRKGNRIK